MQYSSNKRTIPGWPIPSAKTLECTASELRHETSAISNKKAVSFLQSTGHIVHTGQTPSYSEYAFKILKSLISSVLKIITKSLPLLAYIFYIHKQMNKYGYQGLFVIVVVYLKTAKMYPYVPHRLIWDTYFLSQWI